MDQQPQSHTLGDAHAGRPPPKARALVAATGPGTAEDLVVLKWSVDGSAGPLGALAGSAGAAAAAAAASPTRIPAGAAPANAASEAAAMAAAAAEEEYLALRGYMASKALVLEAWNGGTMQQVGRWPFSSRCMLKGCLAGS